MAFSGTNEQTVKFLPNRAPSLRMKIFTKIAMLSSWAELPVPLNEINIAAQKVPATT